MLRSFNTLIASGAVLLFSAACRKADPIIVPSVSGNGSTALAAGLPRGADSINGLLYAVYYSAKVPGTNTQRMETGAVFRDPDANLVSAFDEKALFMQRPTIGNVLAGEVKFNGDVLTVDSLNGRVWYQATATVKSPTVMLNARWSAGGNKTFRPLDLDISRGFPVFRDTLISLSYSDNLMFDPAILFGNYDSVIVAVKTNNTFQKYWTRSDKHTTSVEWLPGDIKGMDTTGNHTLSVILINYSNITVQNKKHVFILAQYAERPVNVVP